MALRSKQVSVATSAVALGIAETGGERVMIRNDGAADAFLGDSTVTAAGGTAGFKLPAGGVIGPFDVPPGEEVYAITASSTTIHVLRFGAR